MTNVPPWLNEVLRQFSPLIFLLRQLGHGLGSIFFIPNPWIGLILWLALLSDPRLGAFAILGLLIGIAIKQATGGREQAHLGGGIKANALLSALAMAWLTSALEAPIWLQIVLVSASAITTALLTTSLMSLLKGSRFPVLVVAYCLVSSSLFTVCPKCTVMAASLMQPWPQPIELVGWTESFVRSIGALVYSPTLAFGSLVCLAIILWSPAAFVCGTFAWLSGLACALALQTMGFWYDFLPLSYNFFMAGVALGAVIFLPGRIGLLIALLAGVFTSLVGLLLQVILQGGAASYLPYSSTLVIWLGIATLSFNGKHSIAKRYLSSRFSPELAWCRADYLQQRFGSNDPLLAVPVEGNVRISQGFSGGITHINAWIYALDFESTTPFQSSYPLLEETLWGVQVISPSAGFIERIRNDVVDNLLGGSNYADNWGNHVVIRLDQGDWIVLAHLMQGSITTLPGCRVEPGSPIGRVGNSGRSPVPHLHMQLQDTPELGAPTRPYRLANFFTAETPEAPWLEWHASSVPSAGRLLRAATRNFAVHQLLSTLLPGLAVWYLEVRGRPPTDFYRQGASKSLSIRISLDESGRYRIDSGKGGRMTARLDPDAWRVDEMERVSCSFLRLLGMSIPSIPFALQQGMTWRDVPPLGPSRMSPLVSLAPFFGKPIEQGQYECLSQWPGQKSIEIKATLNRTGQSLPRSVTCKLDQKRGAVRLHAEFAQGEMDFFLLSFEPGNQTLIS